MAKTAPSSMPAGSKSTCGQRQAELGQPAVPPLLLPGPGGLDGELAGQRRVLLRRKPGTSMASRAGGGGGQLGRGQRDGADHVLDHRADPDVGRLRAPAIASSVSVTGMSSSSVTRCTTVVAERSIAHDRVGLVADRADLGQPGDGLVDVEELGDPAGRRGVQDHGVVRVGRALLAAAGPPRTPCR